MPSAIQSALDPAGLQAARIEGLWWLLFWVCTAVFVAVLGALFLAIRKGRSADPDRPTERSLTIGVAAAGGTTVLILFVLLFVSVRAGRAVDAIGKPADALTVQITGYQWWWHVEYLNPQPSLRITTANELHLPVGRPILFLLEGGDVIHSFWVPNLHGKTDLVPGRQNSTWLQIDRPGVYRGQCAEYCGLQHAHMALVVVAEPEDAFQRWVAAQRHPAPAPSTPEQTRGLDIVERGPCAMCHTIRGTQAGGRMGPDLTHFASRSTIAAGTAPNTPGYLAGWIADPQHLKPGNRMPPTGLASEDLQAVVAYLGSLR
jgi:cytochrome c oxidase subunit 2